MRLSDRREIGSANIGLEAFARILSDYLHFRHDTSITVPSIEYFPAVTSDSQELIGRNLERLNAVGEECIRAHRESTAIAVLRAYDLLTEVATKMHFPRGNPVSSQVLGYLVDYLGIARREWQEEVVFRGVSSLQTLAVFVVRNGDDPATCAGALEEIDNIALGMIARGRFHLIDRCVDGWEQLILEIFGNKFHETEWLLEIILKSMSQLPLGILASPYAQTITHSSSVLTKPFDDMPQVINILAHEATHAKDEDHRRFYGVFLVHFLDDFNGHLINLTEEIKDCNGVIAAAVGRMIGNLSMILLPLIQHEGLKAPVHSDLRKELGWLLAGIPWRFVHYSNTVRGNSSALETLCEGIAMAGVKAQTMFIEDKLVADCIESVDALVND